MLASNEASAEEVEAYFSCENQNSVYQCLVARQKQHVPCVVRVTVLAYTNSGWEKGVQPAKSHMHEFQRQ